MVSKTRGKSQRSIDSKDLALLQRKMKALDLLNRVSRELAGEIDSERVVKRILEVTHEAMGFSHCAVLLLNPERNALCVEASVGYRLNEDAERPRCHVLSQGVTGRVATTGKAELVPDVRLDPTYVEGVSGGRCEMAAPLRCRGKLLGVLDAEATEPNAFDEIDFEAFVAFADQAAVALHNAKLYREGREVNSTLERAMAALADANERLERQVNELATLNEAARVVTANLSLRETLSVIGQMVKRVTDVAGGVIELEGDGNADGAVPLTVEFGESCAGAPRTDAVPESRPDPGMVEMSMNLTVAEKRVGHFHVWRRAARPFRAFEEQTLTTFANQAAIAIENARLFEHTQTTYLQVIRSLAQALEARDSYTKGHSERVMKYTLLIADDYGIKGDEREVLRRAALLHDIGKIGIRDNVLLKPSKLTADEWKLIEGHPAHADAILAPIKVLDEVRHIVRAHHERFDGSGFPAGLSGDEIPLGARIIAVADAFDAMTTDRPYRKGMEPVLALHELRRHGGTQFDAEVVDRFSRLLAAMVAAGRVVKTGISAELADDDEDDGEMLSASERELTVH